MNRILDLLRRGLPGLIAVLMLVGHVCARAQGTGGDFDHLRTGFALTGVHVNTRCESCHLGGVFKGTPRDCESCHVSGARFARANIVKTTQHVPTVAACETCHNTRSFTGARMNHSGVARGSCASCHNGVQASGKTPDHFATIASCDTCHGTASWRTVSRFDHAGVTPGTCATCHDGSKASGRSSSHTPFQLVSGLAGTACDSCHKAGFTAWTPAKLHTSVTVVAQCATCHLPARPANAIHNGQTICEGCHKSTTAWPGAKVDHASFTAATACAACHNGMAATGKASNHIPVAATNCAACHGTGNWKPARFNHTQVPVTAQCATCHTGSFPPADGKPAGHTPYQLVATTASANCDTCHKAGFTTWTPAKLHANAVVTAQCSTCHLSARPNNATHSGQTVCETCHKSTSTWLSAKVDHTTFTVATNCTTCHNGSGATGKHVNHIPVAATNCVACHSPTQIGWRPTKFNHTQVPVTAQCASCHTGSFPPADGKPAGHLPYQLVATTASANCDTCHKGSYTTWTTGKVHANTVITGQCKTCHTSAYASQGATAKPAMHIPEAQLLNGASMECNACHKTTTSWSSSMNHNGSMGGGAGWCKSCHQSGTGYQGGMERKSLTHETKTPPAIDCSESGCHRPLGNKGAAYTKWD